jgi:hypothetical protein
MNAIDRGRVRADEHPPVRELLLAPHFREPERSLLGRHDLAVLGKRVTSSRRAYGVSLPTSPRAPKSRASADAQTARAWVG